MTSQSSYLLQAAHVGNEGKSHTLHGAGLPLPPSNPERRSRDFLESEWNINGWVRKICDLLPYMEDRSHFALTHYFWRQAACQLVSADAKVTDLGKNMGP